MNDSPTVRVQERKGGHPVPNRVASPEPRRVGEIEARVCFHRDVREQREREAREAAEARRKTERAGYLTSLLEDEDSAWSAIDSKLLRGSGSSYDQAFRALQDLAEAYAGAKRDTTFRRRLVRLMAQHGKRGAWVARLTKAGYMWEPRRRATSQKGGIGGNCGEKIVHQDQALPSLNNLPVQQKPRLEMYSIRTYNIKNS